MSKAMEQISSAATISMVKSAFAARCFARARAILATWRPAPISRSVSRLEGLRPRDRATRREEIAIAVIFWTMSALVWGVFAWITGEALWTK